MQAERNHYLMNTEKCSNHKSLLEQLKNYRDGKNVTHRRLRGPTIMEGHAQKSVERKSELAKDRAVKQSLKSLLGRSSFQGGGP